MPQGTAKDSESDAKLIQSLNNKVVVNLKALRGTVDFSYVCNIDACVILHFRFILILDKTDFISAFITSISRPFFFQSMF